MRMDRLIVLALIILVGACATTSKTEREMTETMDAWAAHVRWGEIESLVDFMHPDYLAENPVREMEIERLGLFSVSQYRVRQHLEISGEQAVERVVEIRLYHRQTAQERVIRHREIWRYDSDMKRWFLHSGLPDPTRRS